MCHTGAKNLANNHLKYVCTHYRSARYLINSLETPGVNNWIGFIKLIPK